MAAAMQNISTRRELAIPKNVDALQLRAKVQVEKAQSCVNKREFSKRHFRSHRKDWWRSRESIPDNGGSCRQKPRKWNA